MQTLLLSILATACLITLVSYDFITFCRIIGKEKWVEKTVRSLFPNFKYDEKKMFLLIRPSLLTISMLFFLASAEAIVRLPFFIYFLYAAMILSMLNSLKNLAKLKDKND